MGQSDSGVMTVSDPLLSSRIQVPMSAAQRLLTFAAENNIHAY